METEQLAETVLMKKSKKKHKDKKLRGGRCMGKAEKLKFIENGKCFQILPSFCSSNIERNCALANTNINLQLAYYILEFKEYLFSRASRAQSLVSSEPCQLSKMKLLAVYYFRRSKGSEYATDISQCLLPLSLCIKN